MKVAHPFDKQIQTAIEMMARDGPYFAKSEVLKAVRRQKTVMKIPPLVQEQINLRYIDSRIGSLLQARDHYGVRIYENYTTGTGERRWMKLRAMTLAQLQSAMEATRTQERDLHVKGEGYEIILREMKRIGAKKVDDVYATVAPRIQEYRGTVYAA